MAFVRPGGRCRGRRRARRGHVVAANDRQARWPRRTRSPVEDIDLLADAEAPDFVDDGDDLEFYEWAAGEVES